MGKMETMKRLSGIFFQVEFICHFYVRQMKTGSRYRKWITISLLVIYILNPFKILLPYLNYQLNYTYISSILCENKDNPDTNCEGKCHLKKELKKAAEKETSEQAVSQKTAETEEIPDTDVHQEYHAMVLIENYFLPFLYQLYYPNLPDKVTPPPQA